MPFKPKIMYASCLHQTCWPRIQWGSVIREHLKSGLSNDQALTVAIAIAPAIWNLDIFVWISNGFWQNGGHLSGFQMVGLPNFRSHLKSGPFATQPFFNHSESKLVWISDSHCSTLHIKSVTQGYTIQISIEKNSEDLNTKPFLNQTNLDHLNTKLIWFLDTRRILKICRKIISEYIIASSIFLSGWRVLAQGRGQEVS